MVTINDSYDVIIIGAGPAALSCATGLLGSGRKILIIEQKDEIGPKTCAGGLTRKDLDHIGFPEHLLDHSFDKMSIHTPLASTIVKNTSAMISTVDRKVFADWQLEKLAGAANVKIMTGCKVTGIEEGAVTVNGSISYGYRILVGADGTFSRVRKFLELETEDIAIAIQYLVPSDRFDKLEFFLDSRLFKSWYAWIFPHRGYASVGCMCDPRHLSSKQLQTNFVEWLGKNKIDVAGAAYQGYAINYDYRGSRFGNVFLIGDAAGLASGLTGEGIYQAIVSGEEAAKSILDSGYGSPQLDELLRTKALHNSAMHRVLKMGALRNLFFASLVPLVQNRNMAIKLSRYVS
jgi:flavin-dependent dehydrogenase